MESGVVHVRPAVAGDIPDVIALDAHVTGVAKQDYWNDLFERYSSRRAGERFFLVAEAPDMGQVAGFIIGEVRAWEFGSAPCGWVFAVSVDERARLDGVGTALFEAISADFRRLGMRRMRTMLARDNRLLMSFFRSQGMMAGPYIQLEMELDPDGARPGA